MTTFTPEEIKQARKTPQVGDRWRHNRRNHTVTVVKPQYKELEGHRTMVIDSSALGRHAVNVDVFRQWVNEATLVNRGPA